MRRPKKRKSQQQKRRASERRAKGRRPNQESKGPTRKSPHNEPKPERVPGLLDIIKGKRDDK